MLNRLPTETVASAMGLRVGGGVAGVVDVSKLPGVGLEALFVDACKDHESLPNRIVGRSVLVDGG